MDLDNITKKAYEPYVKEFAYCLKQDIFIGACIILIFIITKVPIFLILLPLYFIIECFLNYRIFLLSRVEIKLSKYTTKKLKIKKIREEFSGSGPWYENSIVGRLYPKELGLERCKIECLDENNKVIKLRLVMGSKKADKLQLAMQNNPNLYPPIIYGELTKIILYFDKHEQNYSFFEANRFF